MQYKDTNLKPREIGTSMPRSIIAQRSPERKLRTEKEGASSSKNGIEDLKTRASKADEKLSIG
ncbi:predicted protein [Botrytis cinerea T4]|uniref:Uncharacterized protein n=1 Tax=Botryotinia fuckeliana (strain T4) TaxID=999810 RepID=G2XXL9_BOTF4|nr:predicted protein [Botrytis cinerea T4]